jgi:hypothetical protein
VFAAAAADWFAWANLFFWEVLPVLWYRHILSAAAAANCSTWSNLNFREVLSML